MVELRLRVIGREDCHLCHDMVADLQVLQKRLAFDFEWLDIEDDVALQGLWAMKIPVLLDEEGYELCHGRLNMDVLEQWFLSRRGLINNG